MSEAALSRATDLPAVWQDLRFEGAVKPAQMIAKSLWRHIIRNNDCLPDLHTRGAGNPFRSRSGHFVPFRFLGSVVSLGNSIGHLHSQRESVAVATASVNKARLFGANIHQIGGSRSSRQIHHQRCKNSLHEALVVTARRLEDSALLLCSKNLFKLCADTIGMKNMCQVMNLAFMLQKALSGARLHIDHTKDFSIAGNLAIGADGELGLSGHIRNSLQLNCCLRLKGVDPDGSAASGQLTGFQFSHGFSGDLGGAGKLEVTSSQGAEERNLLFSGDVHRLIPICAGPFPSPHVNRYNRSFCTLQRLFCKKADKMQNIMRT